MPALPNKLAQCRSGRQRIALRGCCKCCKRPRSHRIIERRQGRHQSAYLSWREKQQAEIRLNVMRVIGQNPEMSSRRISGVVGVSNGSGYYILTAKVEKGSVKLRNFKSNPRMGQYANLLTSKMYPPVALLGSNEKNRPQSIARD